MIGKRVKWLSNNYSVNIENDYRFGTVVAEEGNFAVIRGDGPFPQHISPFTIKGMFDIELA